MVRNPQLLYRYTSVRSILSFRKPGNTSLLTLAFYNRGNRRSLDSIWSRLYLLRRRRLSWPVVLRQLRGNMLPRRSGQRRRRGRFPTLRKCYCIFPIDISRTRYLRYQCLKRPSRFTTPHGRKWSGGRRTPRSTPQLPTTNARHRTRGSTRYPGLYIQSLSFGRWFPLIRLSSACGQIDNCRLSQLRLGHGHW